MKILCKIYLQINTDINDVPKMSRLNIFYALENVFFFVDLKPIGVLFVYNLNCLNFFFNQFEFCLLPI